MKTSPVLLASDYKSTIEKLKANNKVNNYKLGSVGRKNIASLLEPFEYQKRIVPSKAIPDILIVTEKKVPTITTLKKALKLAENRGYTEVYAGFCSSITLRPLPLFIRKKIQAYLMKRATKDTKKREKERNQAMIRENFLRARQAKLSTKNQEDSRE